MILNQLTLANFCVYRGEQTIDLRPTTRNGKFRPIVLFGGINGGGKTTILDAIQLVLYGNRATCSKKNEKSYEQFLRESINRGVPSSQGASISLSFDYASEGEQNTYQVHRQWAMRGSKIKESVTVRKNGKVDHWLSENWAQQVEDLLPQGISQLCFFDAEKIRFLAEDETSNEALGSAIKALLGLDLAERLIADSSVLEGRIAKRARPSEEKSELDSLEKLIAEKSKQVSMLTQDTASLENNRLASLKRLNDTERSFEAIGGKHWEERHNRQQELSATGGRLDAVNSQLSELAASELPLLMVPHLLQSLERRVLNTKKFNYASTIYDLLERRDQNLISTLVDRGVDKKAAEVVEDILAGDRQSRKVDFGSIKEIELSDNGLKQLQSLCTGGLNSKIEATENAVSTARTLAQNIEDTQRALAATPSESGVKEAAEALKLASQEFALLDEQATRLKLGLEQERQARATLEVQASRLLKRFTELEISKEEDIRLLRLVSRTQETMQSFLSRATESKIGRLAEFITESFRFLLRKKSLVHRVVIDPMSFSISLEDQEGGRISKQQLSEGEKQIFAISVLWGLSRASARPLPAIIDTPMGRLDGEHRNALLERYFPNASHQVVILSTDTEIEETAFRRLLPSITRSYHLEYDDTQKSTTATDGYFWPANLA